MRERGRVEVVGGGERNEKATAAQRSTGEGEKNKRRELNGRVRSSSFCFPSSSFPVLSSPLSLSTSSAVTALECAPARRVHRTDSRLFSSNSMPATAAVADVDVEAFDAEISAAEAATLGLLSGGCGEPGRGASIAALATSGERPRRLRAATAGKRRRAGRAAHCCFGVGFRVFFFRPRRAGARVSV